MQAAPHRKHMDVIWDPRKWPKLRGDWLIQVVPKTGFTVIPGKDV